MFLDCRTGVSGDMLLASLMGVVDSMRGASGAGIDALRRGLANTGITGFEVHQVERIVAGTGTYGADIVETAGQPLRTFADIRGILQESALTGTVKKRSLSSLKLLAQAESIVHEVALEDVHFHEIGAVDTIADMVGVMILVEAVSPAKIVASPVDLGSGFVTFSHGTLPVPAPAVERLARPIPTLASDCGSERATPTGVAILSTIADSFGDEPQENLQAVGFGSGTRSTDDNPTFLRAALYAQGDHA